MQINERIFVDDPELNGNLCSAIHHGKDFAFWLAQLSTRVDERPHLISVENAELADQQLPANYYRNPPLSAKGVDFATLQIQKRLFHENSLASLKLWQSMHPDPLSLANDALKIDDEILENCELNVRERLAVTESNMERIGEITPDPTLLESLIPQERNMLV